MTRRRVHWAARGIAVAVLVVTCGAALAYTQAAMPNPREISGVPLPVADIPVGTVTVRVIRGSFANNLSGVSVEFVVNGQPRRVTTDASGRAQVSGLAAGTRVKASTVVDGERLESQDITIGQSGLRVVLAAADPEAAARLVEDDKMAAGTAVRGTVVFGSDSRVVAEFSDERLSIFYALEVLNTARTPVDIGGPVTIELPREARSASVLKGSSPQATANGSHIIITGPFAPGSTRVDVGYELPFSGSTAHLEQRWPIALQQVLVIAPRQGSIDISSAQASNKQQLSSNGIPVVVGTGPGLAAGDVFAVDISGLPHHPRWPRNTALGLASAILVLGIWAAVFPSRRAQAA